MKIIERNETLSMLKMKQVRIAKKTQFRKEGGEQQESDLTKENVSERRERERERERENM